MEKFVIVIMCALCFILNRTISAPVIKASGVQWSEPKGTGKGNITLIMIPQNNSGCNDSDMIVAVKSDYQIMSQDTQLLNLVVNESTNNKTNSSKLDTSLQTCSSLKEDNANKPERETLKHPDTAKYFEAENKLPSENTTNNTVNIYPLLVQNYHNLVALNGTSTTVTVNIFQLLSMNMSNNTYGNSNSLKVSSDSLLNTATSKYNSLNLTEPNSHSVISYNTVKSDSDNRSVVGSDDNFLNEALHIIEKLKQDPSYYNQFKSNQIPSTEEIKEREDISLTGSKTKLLKSDDSALASDEEESLSREFGHIINENQDISNLEGNLNENVPSSTCMPFFLSLISDQTTTQIIGISSPKEISFEQVPLKGTGSNMSQELTVRDNNTSNSDKNSSISSKCKPFASNNVFEEMSEMTIAPVESNINISVGYGVQSNDSAQTMSVKSCKPSSGFYTESTHFTPVTNVTSQTEYGFGVAESFTSVSKGEPSNYYLLQTLAAANMAAGSQLSTADSSFSVAVTTTISVSGHDNYLSQNHSECVTSAKSSEILAPPSLEQANKAPAAGKMMSPATSENLVLSISQQENPVTKADKVDQTLLSRPAVLLDGSTSQSVSGQNELEIKSTECISNTLLIQTVSPTVASPTSVINVAGGLNGLPEMQTECVTDPNVDIKQESGLPQAGVGAIPKKITLEPQVTCTTMKKEESSTLLHSEGQEACLKETDLTLPLVKSSIFLANNNEMPKGKDIPISLNASLDEFILTDLQEKEDGMYGKVAELYNRNPLVFDVEREPTNKLFKPQLKYHKNDVLKSPTIYFDKIYNPDSNKIFKMNLAGKKVILEKPSYKSETNHRMCNNTLENNNKLTNYEIDTVDNDSISVKQEPMAITTPKIINPLKSNAFGGNEEKYLDITTFNVLQPTNEEEKLRTILNTLDKTTFGIKDSDDSQGNFSVMDISTNPPNNNMISIPMPANDDKVLNPQESGQNNKSASSSTGKEDSENMNSQLNNLLTTKQPNVSQKPNLKPKGRLSGKTCSKPYKTITNRLKTTADFSKASSSNATAKDKNTLTKENMCIPAESLQKIVIEIVRNTKKPDNKPDSYSAQTTYYNEVGVQSVGEKKEETPYKEMRNIKQNFVPFQSAWKPIQPIENQKVYQLNDALQSNSGYSNNKIKDGLKIEAHESDGIPEKYLQNQNNNRFSERQDTFNEEQNPTVVKEFNSPFYQTATNHEKSLGANTLKLLMADKPVVKSE